MTFNLDGLSFNKKSMAFQAIPVCVITPAESVSVFNASDKDPMIGDAPSQTVVVAPSQIAAGSSALTAPPASSSHKAPPFVLASESVVSSAATIPEVQERKRKRYVKASTKAIKLSTRGKKTQQRQPVISDVEDVGLLDVERDDESVVLPTDHDSDDDSVVLSSDSNEFPSVTPPRRYKRIRTLSDVTESSCPATHTEYTRGGEPESEYEVERIIDARRINVPGGFVMEYLVQWLNFGPEHDSWVKEDDLDAEDALQSYYARSRESKTSRISVSSRARKSTPTPTRPTPNISSARHPVIYSDDQTHKPKADTATKKRVITTKERVATPKKSAAKSKRPAAANEAYAKATSGNNDRTASPKKRVATPKKKPAASKSKTGKTPKRAAKKTRR